MSKGGVSAKVFWSGGSQAVRLPKAMRMEGGEVKIRRRGRTLIVEPLEVADEWGDFWDRLEPLRSPLRRWKTRPVTKRAAI
jgi:antitoxin VapB